MNRTEILNTARQAVTVDRAATHGSAEDNFRTIGQLWAVRLGIPAILPERVAIMLTDLKTARAWGNPSHADNWVDLCGYGACGGEIGTASNTPTENLAFREHVARRDAERTTAAEDDGA